jgi:3'-phosphoadenosine 5'-phosphosulfate (PAPS) 3'-phosphatase
VLAAAGGAVTDIKGAPLLYGNAACGFESPEFVAWGRALLPWAHEA